MQEVFVARRFDRDPNLQILFYSYFETIRSKPFEINGVVSNTMFCKKRVTLLKLIKEGWVDCTKEYLLHLENEKSKNIKIKEEPKKVVKKRGRPKSSSKRK